MHRVVEEARNATLYVVATPIGNLRDISLRALDILASVDVVVAEDTRVCGKLLSHLGIKTRMISAHEHNEKQSAAGVVKLLEQGQSIALTTDAGTPAISDPGAEIVARVREQGYAVVPVPGPSALTAALSVCGKRFSRVLFCGFLPAREGERKRAIEQLAGVPATLVFYEAPHRISKTIDDLSRILGTDGRIVLCRELTKMYEQIHECSLGDARTWLESSPDHMKGEFVLVVEPERAEQDEPKIETDRVLVLLSDELPMKTAVALTAAITGGRKNAIYRRALELAREKETDNR